MKGKSLPLITFEHKRCVVLFPLLDLLLTCRWIRFSRDQWDLSLFFTHFLRIFFNRKGGSSLLDIFDFV